MKVSKTKVLMNNKRRVGLMIAFDSGALYYIAYKRMGQAFRDGEKDVSSAVRTGEACWVIEEDILFAARAKKVTKFCVFCKNTGDLWVTDINHYFDRKKSRTTDFTPVGQKPKRYLPFQYFVRKCRPGLAK